jgi:general secretion pathway protein G
MYRRNYRSGFSLIELLIVVAIIAALIGVAVPYFQSNLAEAQITKAKQDLDTVRNAINLYESRFKPIVGTDLKQILGQTMNEIPPDPWGNPYMLDANIGIIFSYGSDGIPGGTAADADQFFLYKPKLQVRKCEYEGSYGPPQKDVNKMTLYFTKPFDPSGYTKNGDMGAYVRLRWDIGTASTTAGAETSGTLATLFGAGVWTESGSDPANGVLRLKASLTPTASVKQTITPTMAVDLDKDQTVFKVLASTGSRLVTSGTAVAGPGDFLESVAVKAENGIGARIERKM